MSLAIQTADVQATGTLVATGCIILGVHVESGGTAGQLILRDNGAGGTTKMTVDTPAAVGMTFISTHDGMGNGLEFLTDCHATLTNVAGVTVVFK